MSEKPILFNTEMVRAILEGRKTVTRRAVKPHYKDYEAGFRINRRVVDGVITGVEYYDEEECGTGRYIQPPYQIGDILYVRETWKGLRTGNEKAGYKSAYWYKADDTEDNPDDLWRPSIHMPREAARIWLKVTDVRVERLNNMSVADIDKEGLVQSQEFTYEYFGRFINLWNSTIKKQDIDRYGWDANPLVWVIEFERVEKRREAE